jgi:phytoene synthase
MTPAAAALTPKAITARSGSSFLSGFLCLDRRRRAGMTAIYAFCRVADDAVDDAPTAADGRAQLEFWRSELDAAECSAPRTPVGRALQATFAEFGACAAPLRELLAGVAMDLECTRYADLAALEVYCHRVASAVGLACLPVLGVEGELAERFAERLGRALQLTNILRDLRADAELGRVYAPDDWLQGCGVEVGWLRGGGPAAVYAQGGQVGRLCARLAAAARERFAEASAALLELPAAARRRLLPARIMGVVYRDLLRRLEARGGGLGGPRVRVPRARKLWLAAATMIGAHW